MEKSSKSLCKMCGICCRTAVPSFSYKELMKAYEDQNQDAIDFLDMFIPYENIEEVRSIFPEHVDNIIKNLNILYGENCKKTFYKCKYISENNKCTKYEDRPNLCRRFPSTIWTCVPPSCGYNEQFKSLINTHIEYVQKIKQTIKDLKLQPEDKYIKSKQMTVKEIIEDLNKRIEPYNKYGAKDW